ncbi:DsbA family oxidoreductase [Streptomyces sp. WM6386]|uniref:DsbA family oxidoreductase n=1 Tax=Streptomyces sp. WM6386 TaxID=1415558 RepID=UPI000619D62D|nr:DsbA family oxidoreductase [Streptomyces sp. WM6386]KKD09196.1 protein-disulfide isomerase [Streptomyces sp. WM6386]
MKVEIWSEITCPWCGLGSHRLDRAVERFEHGDEVEVIHRSFPISDSFAVGSTVSVREATLRKYGLADASLETTTRQIEGMAEQEGLSPYRVLDNQVGNTRLAHEFLAHASAEGKNRVAWDGVFRAYFGQARPVFGLDDLLDLADEFGLEREKTRRVLTEGRYRQQVQDELEQAQQLGATGAPFIVVDGRYGIPGAQNTDALLGVLRQAWDETHPTVLAAGSDAALCGPDGCAVPADHATHA